MSSSFVLTSYNQNLMTRITFLPEYFIWMCALSVEFVGGTVSKIEKISLSKFQDTVINYAVIFLESKIWLHLGKDPLKSRSNWDLVISRERDFVETKMTPKSILLAAFTKGGVHIILMFTIRKYLNGLITPRETQNCKPHFRILCLTLSRGTSPLEFNDVLDFVEHKYFD